MIRTAVIGAGLIAKQHLAALARLDHVRIVGICDRSPITAEAAADRFGITAWFQDHRELLAATNPQVVHVVTPAATHFAIARDCLEFGANVFVEKPATLDFAELDELLEIATDDNLWLIEDHNYQFNSAIQEMLSRLEAGEFGAIRHVDVQLNLAIYGPGSRFSDPDLPHPALQMPIGPVADFLTHLCYLAYIFIGPHRSVHCAGLASPAGGARGRDNFQVLVTGNSATASLGFSADSQPDSFVVRVHGTRMQMETNLFEVGVLASRVLGGPKPLLPVRNALARSRAERRNALGNLLRKLGGGPGAYEGLWKLVRQLYDRLEQGGPPPIPVRQLRDVNRLVHEIAQGAETPCAC